MPWPIEFHNTNNAHGIVGMAWPPLIGIANTNNNCIANSHTLIEAQLSRRMTRT